MARLARSVALVFAVAWSLAPVYWMLATSFKTEIEATRLDPTAWPHAPTLANSAGLAGGSLPFASFFANTALTCLLTAAVADSVRVAREPFRPFLEALGAVT